MTTTRRTLVAATLAVPLARPALAQPRPALRVQSIGTVETILRNQVIPAFQDRHGADVQLIIEDDVTILPKLQVSRSRAPYDVCMMDNDKAILGAEAGLWAPDQSGRLSNIGALYPSCRPPAVATYATFIFEYGLAFRTDRFAVPPSSWADLWAPGITVAVPHVSQAYGLTFLYIAAMLNGGGGANLEPGFAAIKRLGSIRIYRSVSQGLALFQQKEADIGLFYSHRTQSMMEAGLPVGRAKPGEGVWGLHTGLQIPRQTANMDGAVAWIDTMLSVPVQAAFAAALYSPTNKEVPFTPQEAARLVAGPARVEAIREAPWAEILPQRDAILDRWTREFGS